MKTLVGYRINGDPGIWAGDAYSYIMAGDGIYLGASGKHIGVRIPIAPINIRGLPNLFPVINLRHGRIPRQMFDLALSVFLARPDEEVYLAITWDECRYQIIKPMQEGTAGQVKYSTVPHTVLDLHSHGRLGPGFSGQDDRDEQGFRLYGCVGGLYDAMPSVNLRVGVYGYWMPVRFEDVFDVPPYGVIDVYGLGEVPGKEEDDAVHIR